MADRSIPEAIKRQVRQECYFGCVICGEPIFHYDHIIEFSKVHCHEASNIALLCPNHHNLKSCGRMRSEFVKKHRANPYNSRSAVTSKTKVSYIDSEEFLLKIGDSYFKYKFRENISIPVIRVDGEPLIKFQIENGEVLPSIFIRNSDFNPILVIEKGEIQVSTRVFDYTCIGKLITIKSQGYGIDIQIKYCPTHVEIIKAKLLGWQGTRVELREGCFIILNNNDDGNMNLLIGDVQNLCNSFYNNIFYQSNIDSNGYITSSSIGDEMESIYLKEKFKNNNINYYLKLNYMLATYDRSTNVMDEKSVNVAIDINEDIYSQSSKTNFDKKVYLFNKGNYLRRLAVINNDVELFCEAMKCYNENLIIFSVNYNDLQKAQLYWGLIKCTCEILGRGRKIPRDMILRNIGLGNKSREIYSAQDKIFLDKWRGTISQIDEHIAIMIANL